jgi:integrase
MATVLAARRAKRKLERLKERDQVTQTADGRVVVTFDKVPIELRVGIPVGPLLCMIDGPTRGRPWASDAARAQLRRVVSKAGVRRRFAPHQLRHAHAVELAHEGVALNVIQRQLGHTNFDVTSIYLQGSTTPRSSPPSAPARRR